MRKSVAISMSLLFAGLVIGGVCYASCRGMTRVTSSGGSFSRGVSGRSSFSGGGGSYPGYSRGPTGYIGGSSGYIGGSSGYIGGSSGYIGGSSGYFGGSSGYATGGGRSNGGRRSLSPAQMRRKASKNRARRESRRSHRQSIEGARVQRTYNNLHARAQRLDSSALNEKAVAWLRTAQSLERRGKPEYAIAFYSGVVHLGRNQNAASTARQAIDRLRAN